MHNRKANPNTSQTGLIVQTTRSIAWSALSQIGKIISQLLSLTVLTRLVAPNEYGLVAMAATISGFASLFKDMGTSTALIQSRDLSQRAISAQFWQNILSSTILFILFSTIAVAVGRPVFGVDIGRISIFLLLPIIINSLSSIQQALLERANRFKEIALIELTATSISLAIAIISALHGYGAYSYAYQAIAASTIGTVLIWIRVPWQPMLVFSDSETTALRRFGNNLVGFNIVNYWVRNADNIIIGHCLGAEALGIYSLAYKLMLWPLQNISQVFLRGAYPSMSAAQSNNREMQKIFTKLVRGVSFITFPIMTALFIMPDAIVLTLFGQKWGSVGAIIQILAPVGLLQSIGTLVGLIYFSTARTDIMFKWGIFSACLTIPAFLAGTYWGITGVASAYTVVATALFIPALALPLKLISLPTHKLLLATLPTLLSSSATGALVFYMKISFLEALFGPLTLPNLALTSLAFLVIYLLISLIANPDLLHMSRGIFLNRTNET